MGNCSNCCGKADMNEVSTDKTGKKGASTKKDIDKNTEDLRISGDSRLHPANRGYSGKKDGDQQKGEMIMDEFQTGELEINNESYNN